tara:strand:+ start:825 stop:1037 length:213 start_codon:yes stop_codon:yes gene_type:complete
MDFKELMISMQSDMLKVAKEKPSYSYGNLNIYPEDRHDSDAEEFRNESKRKDFDAMDDAGMSEKDFHSEY